MTTTKLEPGMLLLGGLQGVKGEPLDHIWTVVSPRTIICHTGSIQIKSTLTKSGVPPGWRVLDNRALAALVQEEGTSGPRP